MVFWKVLSFCVLFFLNLSPKLLASFITSAQTYCSNFPDEKISQISFDEMQEYVCKKSVIQSVQNFLQESREINPENSISNPKDYIMLLYLRVDPSPVFSGKSEEETQSVKEKILAFYESHKTFCNPINSLPDKVAELSKDLMLKANELHTIVKTHSKEDLYEQLAEMYKKIYLSCLDDVINIFETKDIKFLENFAETLHERLKQLKILEEKIAFLFKEKGVLKLRESIQNLEQRLPRLVKIQLSVLKKFSHVFFNLDFFDSDETFTKEESHIRNEFEKTLFLSARAKLQIGFVRSEKYINSFWEHQKELNLDSSAFFSPQAFEILLIKTFSNLSLWKDSFENKQTEESSEEDGLKKHNFKIALRAVYENFLKKESVFKPNNASLEDLVLQTTLEAKYFRNFDEIFDRSADFSDITTFTEELIAHLKESFSEDEKPPLKEEGEKYLRHFFSDVFKSREELTTPYSLKGLPEIFLYRKENIEFLEKNIEKVVLKSVLLFLMNSIFEKEGLTLSDSDKRKFDFQFESNFSSEKENNFSEIFTPFVFSKIYNEKKKTLNQSELKNIQLVLNLVPKLKDPLNLARKKLSAYLERSLLSDGSRTISEEESLRDNFLEKDIKLISDHISVLIRDISFVYTDFVMPVIEKKRNRNLFEKLLRFDETDQREFKHFSEIEFEKLQALNLKLDNLCSWIHSFNTWYRFLEFETLEFQGNHDLYDEVTGLFNSENKENFLLKDLHYIKNSFFKKEGFPQEKVFEIRSYLNHTEALFVLRGYFLKLVKKSLVGHPNIQFENIPHVFTDEAQKLIREFRHLFWENSNRIKRESERSAGPIPHLKTGRSLYGF